MTAPEAARPSDWRVENVVIACDRDAAGAAVYRVVVSHDHPAPADLAIGCLPPPGSTGVSASTPPKAFRDGVVWEFSAVPPGETVALQVRFAGGPATPHRFRVATRRAAVPVLGVRLGVPPVVRLDAEFDATVTVTNAATAAAAHAVAVAVRVPEEVLYRSATAGGLLAESGDAAVWTIPSLAAGAEWTGVARLVGFAPGSVRLTATAAASGAAASASADLICEVPHSTQALADLLAGLGAEADDLSAGNRGDESGVPHLVFRVGENRFALGLADVSEVSRPAGLTPVPGMPPWLAGVANVRGDLVPVVVLGDLLGVAAAAAARALIVVRPAAEDDEGVGLLADDVVGIRSLTAGADLPGELADDARGRFVLGLAGGDAAGSIQRLDLGRVLAAVDVGLGQTT